MGVLVLLPMIPGVIGALYPLGNAPWMYATPMLGPYVLLTNVLGGQTPAMNAFLISAGISIVAAAILVRITCHAVRKRAHHLWPIKRESRPHGGRRPDAGPDETTTCPRCGESHDLAKVKGCIKCLKCGFNSTVTAGNGVVSGFSRTASARHSGLLHGFRRPGQQFPPISTDSRNKVSQQFP